MFTLFSLIKSYPIPQAHNKMMLWYLDKYANTDAGRWLKTVRYRDMSFWYCYGMTADILGAFLSLFKKHIFLRPQTGDQDPMQVFAQPVTREQVEYPQWNTSWVDVIVSTAVHQLRHSYQRRRLGPILYTLCCLPVVRQITIQRDAHKIWNQCQDYFQQLAALLAHQSFIQRMGYTQEDFLCSIQAQQEEHKA